MVGGAFSKIRKSLLSRRRNRNKSDLSIKSGETVGHESNFSGISHKLLKSTSFHSLQNQAPQNVIQLPQNFYDKEKKLLALENAYVTLKKVLFKYFSLEAKQQSQDNVSQSLRRSFHEALHTKYKKVS